MKLLQVSRVVMWMTEPLEYMRYYVSIL